MILRVDRSLPEAILTLCWSLVADLKLEHVRLSAVAADMTQSEVCRDSKAIVTKLEFAEDCLRTLHNLLPGLSQVDETSA